MPVFSSLYGTYLTHELGTDDSTVLFTTDRRKRALKDGIAQFADLSECLARTAVVTITSTAYEYDLNALTNADFARFAAGQSIVFQYTDASSNVSILAGREDLPHRTVAWLDNYEPGWRNSSASTSMQMPSATYLRPDGAALWLGFTPPPSSGSSASMLARVPYVPYIASSAVSTSGEPWTFNSSARIDLRPYFMAPVHYAAHQLEKLRRDQEASDRQLQKFLGYVQRHTQAMRQKGGTVLTYARSYFRRSLGGGSDRGTDPRT
jgi:hypothetical protein